MPRAGGPVRLLQERRARPGGWGGEGKWSPSPPRACAPRVAGTWRPPHPYAVPLAGAEARAEGGSGEAATREGLEARGRGGAAPEGRAQGRRHPTRARVALLRCRGTGKAAGRLPGAAQAGGTGGARSRPAAGLSQAAPPRPWFLFLDGSACWDASWQVLLGRVGAI